MCYSNSSSSSYFFIPFFSPFYYFSKWSLHTFQCTWSWCNFSLIKYITFYFFIKKQIKFTFYSFTNFHFLFPSNSIKSHFLFIYFLILTLQTFLTGYVIVLCSVIIKYFFVVKKGAKTKKSSMMRIFKKRQIFKIKTFKH